MFIFRYVNCVVESCPCKGVINDDILQLTAEHTPHATSEIDIEGLQLRERCRKRAANEPSESLREIFDQECRGCETPGLPESVTFNSMESSMYKRRRMTLPAIPQDSRDTESYLRQSGYALRYVTHSLSLALPFLFCRFLNICIYLSLSLITYMLHIARIYVMQLLCLS